MRIRNAAIELHIMVYQQSITHVHSGFCNGDTVTNKFENLQHQMARVILKAPRNVLKEALSGEFGWRPISSIQNISRVLYFNRIKTMDDNRWHKLLLNAIFTTASNLKWNWLRQIKSVLVYCGMDRVLNMDSPTNPQWTSTFKNIYKVADNNGWYMHQSSGEIICCKLPKI